MWLSSPTTCNTFRERATVWFMQQRISLNTQNNSEQLKHLMKCCYICLSCFFNRNPLESHLFPFFDVKDERCHSNDTNTKKHAVFGHRHKLLSGLPHNSFLIIKKKMLLIIYFFVQTSKIFYNIHFYIYTYMCIIWLLGTLWKCAKSKELKE